MSEGTDPAKHQSHVTAVICKTGGFTTETIYVWILDPRLKRFMSGWIQSAAPPLPVMGQCEHAKIMPA